VMQSRNRSGIVLALFFFSGATALVYEVVWSKFLSQMFGSTIYAQTVVLAVFMGGLALGNKLFGRWADRVGRPVQAYGLLEALIGIYALFFLTLDRATDHVFVSIGSHITEQAGLLLALKGALSAGLLLCPTILMGGTLPLMAAWLQRSSTDAGRRSARFYSVNSLGAVAGATLAGFWLVQDFGLVSTMRITALANLIVGGLAIWIGKNDEGKQERSSTEPAPATEPEVTAPQTLRWAGLIVAMTGGVSMGLEVLSSRALALIFGSSLQTFAVVLMAFILGIGLGSAWIASPRRKVSGERTIVLLLCVAAAWVVFLVFNIERWVDFYRIVHTGLSRTAVGYVFHQFFATGMSLLILGVPAALIGAVLPLMIRAVSNEGAPLGAKVGSLLTWNTLGAVVGTLSTGFILMPKLGLRNAFGVLALTLAFVGLVVAWRRGWRAGMTGAFGICLLAGSLFVFGGEGWRHVMSSGVFRIRETAFEPSLMSLRKDHIKIKFYEDSPDATVSVEEVDGIIGMASLGLRINGKPDAGTLADMGTQLLVSHLPMLIKPDAKDVFVLGLGSGISAGALLAYPVERIDVAENCEPVVRAARLFEDWNYHVLDNPRTHMWTEDARTVLKLRPQLYDVIITVPSNPWTAGIGSVFSKEYYELAARRLKPGGIVAQWFQVYEMQDDVVQLVLRTFRSVFPFVEIWDSGGDIILLGSMQPWQTGPEAFRQGFAIDRVRTDMWMIDIHSPEALLAKQLASQRTGFAIAADGAIQSDMFPILEYAAPKAFYIGAGTRMLDRYDERTWQQLLAPPGKSAVLHSLPNWNAQVIFSTFSTINGELFGCVFGTPLGKGVPCAFDTPLPAPAPASSGSVLDQAEQAIAVGNLDLAAQYVSLGLNVNPQSSQGAYLARVVKREQQLRQMAVEKRASR
jgi:spermidine synthase